MPNSPRKTHWVQKPSDDSMGGWPVTRCGRRADLSTKHVVSTGPQCPRDVDCYWCRWGRS